MFKSLVMAAVICAIPAFASAKAFKIGDEATWISIPDTWEPDTFDNGVEGTSPDKETYVAAEIVQATEIKAAGDEADKFFTKSGIKVDVASKKEKEIKMAGLPAYDISWNATDKDGPTHVSLTLVKLDDAQFLLLTYWGSAKGEDTNGKDLAAIADSIKPIK